MAEDAERETARLFRVSRTIHELVRDRGYEIADEEITMKLERFKELYASAAGVTDKARLSFKANTAEKDGGEIYVFYSDEAAVGIKTMRKFITILEEQKIPKGILIYKTSMTPSANKVISAMASQYQIEAFPEAELLVNITHHCLVPRHDVLTKQEKIELLQKYRLKDTQLPRIQLSDPVSRYYGLKRGQVVKITRPSETSGRYVSYRLCL
ncbi:DNA-directed RNA polymerases II 24 kDa polypeptide (RNA polymerase II subunit 5) [Microbotryomycetes sp. JL221]|nr:DNA-directed RNA polymerases II 24 kDa polypeptide (RNA polymerase II subunit 5) [Microbotryomycetes sp. JL221]